jgi:hypothetical protein
MTACRLSVSASKSQLTFDVEEDAMPSSRALRTIAAFLVIVLSAGACAGPARTGWDAFGQGLKNLALSPLMIVSGLAQGLAFLPYTIGMGLGELNQALLSANAVSLDDAYKATFSVPMTAPTVDQKTGDVHGQDGLYGRFKPEAIFEANRAFHRLLVSQGMAEERARDYALVGNYSYAFSRGQILLAVVRRHTGPQPFRVLAKQTGIVTTFRPDQRAWYEAYDRDVDSRAIDEVLDWTAIEYAVLRQDKVVATLMAIAAEAVKADKRAPEYWEAQRRWLAGDTTTVMHESMGKVKRALPG